MSLKEKHRINLVRRVIQAINFLEASNSGFQVKEASLKTIRSKLINSGLIPEGTDENRYAAMCKAMALGNIDPI